MKPLIVFFVVFNFTSETFSQSIKFEEVSEDELRKTHCEFDSTASAEYLFNELKVTYQYVPNFERFEYKFSVHQRIKIYNEKGLDLAEQQISLYTATNNSKQEKVFNFDAYTFNLNGSKIRKIKLDKDNVFVERESKYITSKKFSMPEVKPGSVLDIRYTIRSPLIYSVSKFDIQKDHPVSVAHVRYEIPEYFTYNHNMKGSATFSMTKEEKSDRIRYSYVEKTNGNFRSRKQKKYVDQVYKTMITDYSTENIPALVKEDFVSAIENFRSSIALELLATLYPQSTIEYYTKDWNDVVENLMQRDDFGGQLNRNYKEHDDFISSVKGLEDDKKIIAIYNLVRDTYTWNRFYSDLTSDDGIDGMIKIKIGNSADINLLLVNLLKMADVDVFPLLIRNRYSGFLNIANPSLDDLNYVMAVVQLPESLVYLDATEKGLQAGMLPGRALNLKGVAIVDGNGSEVPIVNANKVIGSRQLKLNLNDDDSISGQLTIKDKAYGAYRIRSQAANVNELKEHLENIHDVDLSNMIVEGLDEAVEQVVVTADVVYNGDMDLLDGKIFLPFGLGEGIVINPFNSDTRTLPLFFDNELALSTIVSLSLPEGYVVESMPEKLLISLPNKIMTYHLEGKQIGKDIIITIRQKRNETTISDEYYPMIRLFYEKAIEKSKEMIVLRKS